MSFFDDASLVMIPSGYKNQKVYSVKPTDGTGDLTFSRASSATRVASNGLIEKVRENLILQSQDFTTSWSAASATVTANTTANPLNGAINADTITLTGATTQKFVNQAFVFSGTYTTSVYLKAGTHQFVQLMLGTDPTPFANFDLVNGTASATSSTATIVAAGGGWYRCSMSFTSVLGTTVFITAADSLATPRFQPTASTGTYIAFGYQLETGDIATDYIATTTAAVSVGPVSGLPRLDYLGSTCPRLLLEPQRTNLITFSEQVDNAAWTKAGTTITANAAVSPDGYTNADKLVAAASAGDKYALQILTVTNAVAYTSSAYFKAAEYTYAFMRLGGVDGNPYVIYNLATQAVVATSGSISSTITSVGNGWYRVAVTATQTSTTLAPVLMFLPSTGYTLTGSNIPQFTGNGTSGGFIWGAQSEQGAYATSYIPTLGASVTRVADIASKTGISSLIGQTEGTLFAEFTRLNVGNAVVMFQCNDGTTNNRAQLEIGATGIATTSVLSGGAVSCVITGATLALGQTHKLALTYKANDFKLYVNGVLAGTDTSGAVPISMSRIDLASELGTSFGGVSISQILNFTTALNNAQAIELTA